MKKILSIILTILMIATTLPIAFAEGTTYEVGDIVQFGTYPQSEVKDETLIAELNALAPDWDNWTSYGYYSGNGDVYWGASKAMGTMVKGDWMRYVDIIYKSDKYRGVEFIKYRPGHTCIQASSDIDSTITYQYDNGYYVFNTYWFKFEPIDWRVLDPDTGLVMCETVIDSQPYSNTIYKDSSASDSTYAYFNDALYTNYANDYETSSIRQWLNNDFYNTAFDENEKEEIFTTTINNKCYGTSIGNTGYEMFDSEETQDKLFLLSYDEITNSKYGFNSNGDSKDTARRSKSSDYAKNQGLNMYDGASDTYKGNAYVWLLRSAGVYSDRCCFVLYNGSSDKDAFIGVTALGVRPALCLDMFANEHTHTYTSKVTKEPTHLATGVTTYTCECGDSYTEDIAKLTGHTYTSKITTLATHTKEGVETFTCACGDSYTKPVAKLEGHTYTSKVTKEATHLTTGETTYTCECGDSYTEEIAKITEHTYEAVVTAPTCKTKGYTTYTCECGHSYIGDYVAVLKHNYTSMITKNPTHLTVGKKTYTCSLCGDVYTEDIARTPEHTYSVSKVTEPTCTDKGYTTYTCACGESYKDNYVSAKGHNYSGEICKSCGKKCSHICHKSGFMGFIWKIVRFFCKLFKCKPVCACGIAHY